MPAQMEVMRNACDREYAYLLCKQRARIAQALLSSFSFVLLQYVCHPPNSLLDAGEHRRSLILRAERQLREKHLCRRKGCLHPLSTPSLQALCDADAATNEISKVHRLAFVWPGRHVDSLSSHDRQGGLRMM